jgi:hypothetical protein
MQRIKNWWQLQGAVWKRDLYVIWYRSSTWAYPFLGLSKSWSDIEKAGRTVAKWRDATRAF